MTIKKRKLEEMTNAEKKTVKKAMIYTLLGVALICCILISCFSCKNDMGTKIPDLTDAQKAALWYSNITDIWWTPQTDSTNDGVLKDLFAPRDAHTVYDSELAATMVYFLFGDDTVMTQATVVLTNESGKLVFESEDEWPVKFSEKNGSLYMTITDSDGKTVFYSQR